LNNFNKNNRVQRSPAFFAFVLLVVFYGLVNAQSKDPDKILKNVEDEFNKIKDYEVDVHIKVNISFLKMPETDAKVYFKKPDKIHITSDKFAMLPKEGLNFSPLSFLNDKFTALYEREDTIGIPVSVIKVIPIGNDNDIILTTFWIDQNRNLIMKIESSRKPMGTFQLEFTYEKYDEKYIMPSSMTFTFTIDRTHFPKGMDGQLESGDENDSSKSKTQTGKVYLTYKNYKINQNLPDSLFEDKINTKN
jgi:hypothetical protein